MSAWWQDGRGVSRPVPARLLQRGRAPFATSGRCRSSNPGAPVVTVYDIDDYTPVEDERARFTGREPDRWRHLIGTPNPGRHWTRGMARPVQYFDTATLEQGDTLVEETAEGRRAVVGGVTLIVDQSGDATVMLPAGRSLTVLAVTADA